METEIKEIKLIIAKRVPPGDKWKLEPEPNITSSVLRQSLTDALEAYYQKNGDTQFYIDAKEGTVSVVKSLEVEKPIRKYSLYGEE